MEDKNLNYIIYGTNFAAKSLINASSNYLGEFGSKIKDFSSSVGGIGHMWGPMIFTAVDFLSKAGGKLNRSVKSAGTLFYGIQAAADLVQIGNGHLEYVIPLFFDGSMAYVAGKDAVQGYLNNKTDPIKDSVETWKGLEKRLKKK